MVRADTYIYTTIHAVQELLIRTLSHRQQPFLQYRCLSKENRYYINMANLPFSELIKDGTPTLVDFHAEWCGPCKMMKPELDALKSALGSKIRIIKIDIDKNPKVANTFKVQSVPTLMIFKEGNMKWRQSGAMTSHQLQQILKPFLP